MTEGRSEDFKKRFLVTHFFNPVRYMKLLELVAGEKTDPAVMQRLADFGEKMLGKGIVYGKDTTNFIANRIGIYGMMRTLRRWSDAGIVGRGGRQDLRARAGPPQVGRLPHRRPGRPRHVPPRGQELLRHAHPGRGPRHLQGARAAWRRWSRRACWATRSGGGFYKKQKGGEGEKEILALDLKTLEYRPQKKVRFESLGAAKDIETLPERIAHRAERHRQGRQVRRAGHPRHPGLRLAPLGEIADDYVNVDRAMRWGFAWDIGPLRDLGRLRREEGRRADEGARAEGGPLGRGDARLGPHSASTGGRQVRHLLGRQGQGLEEGAGGRARRSPSSCSSAATRRSPGTTRPRLWDMGDGVAAARVPLEDEHHRLDDRRDDGTRQSTRPSRTSRAW